MSHSRHDAPSRLACLILAGACTLVTSSTLIVALISSAPGYVLYVLATAVGFSVSATLFLAGGRDQHRRGGGRPTRRRTRQAPAS